MCLIIVLWGVSTRIMGNTDSLLEKRRKKTDLYKNYSYDEYAGAL